MTNVTVCYLIEVYYFILMKKTTLYAVALVVVLALLAGVLVWQKEKKTIPNQVVENTPVEQVEPLNTADWKTYRNGKPKFSIQYPETYVIDTKPRDNGFIISFLGFDRTRTNLSGESVSGYYPFVSIYFWTDINNSDLKGGNWENEKVYHNIDEFLNDSKHTHIIKIKEIVVAEKKAYVLSMPGEIGYEAIMFEGSGGFYRISFPAIHTELNSQIKERFLSSFKFE